MPRAAFIKLVIARIGIILRKLFFLEGFLWNRAEIETRDTGDITIFDQLAKGLAKETISNPLNFVSFDRGVSR